MSISSKHSFVRNWFQKLYKKFVRCNIISSLAFFLYNILLNVKLIELTSSDHDKWGMQLCDMLLRQNSTWYPSVGNLRNPPFGSWGLWCQSCEVVTCHTVTVTVEKNTRVKTWCLVLKLWLCNKSAVFLEIFTNKIGTLEWSVRFLREK